ncbi:unnamed protein product, partial [Adineta ricciae]
LNLKINSKPSNGTCSIDQINGTIETLFQIKCFNWQIEENIKDYSLFYWSKDPTKQTIVAFSPISNFTVRLPSGNLHLLVQIRDLMNSIAEFNISSTISVTSKETKDFFVELRENHDQNSIGQIISSISQQLNQ